MAQQARTAWIEQIPVIWYEPVPAPAQRRLAIFLNGLSGTKEDLAPYLQDLAAAGLVALSFDAWEHGERSNLTGEELIARAFGDFRRHMWVTIGQTALDTLRVLDWAVANLDVSPEVCMGGLSMGGDIAVAAAGLDQRIQKVGAVVATPDWTRPGMVDLRSAEKNPLPPGEPDAYARWFYERINPITHLEHYAHAPQIRFVCGAKDDHVPPEAAFRFKDALLDVHPRAGGNIIIELIPGQDHGGMFGVREQWWPGLLEWLAG